MKVAVKLGDWASVEVFTNWVHVFLYICDFLSLIFM